jgi:outer membrane protein TolC
MRIPRFVAVILLAVLAGCQSLVPRRAPDEIPLLKVEPQSADELPPAKGTEPAKSPDELQRPFVSESLTLLDAAAIALAQNPDLVAARQAEGVSLGALGVAQTYPFNPWVQIQLTPDPRLHDGSTGTSAHYVLLMQTLQLAHQRRHREAAAVSVLNGTRWAIVQAELQAVAQTERFYFAALYQRELRDIFRANADLSRQVLEVSEKQLAAGALSKADVAIARLDEAAARRRADLAEANYQTALLDLRRQLGYPMETPLALGGSLAKLQFSAASEAAQHWGDGKDTDAVPADLAQFAGTLGANRPDVLAAHSDFDAARANLDLAHANRVPDLQIGPYYQRTDSGATLWGFRAHSDLPILNSGLPLARQRTAELIQRQTIWEQLQTRATLEAQAAIDRYERARRIVAASQGEGSELPEALAKLETQFQAGEIDILRIVTARTSLLTARQSQLEIQNELAQAAAALTASAGVPPEAIVQVESK